MRRSFSRKSEADVQHADPGAREFWDSCRAGAMALQRCTACGRFRYPPRGVCPFCLSVDARWTAVRGTGVVYVALVVYPRSRDPQQAPSSLVIVELDEGVRMWSSVVGCAPESVKIGDRVRLTYDEAGLPRFTLAE